MRTAFNYQMKSDTVSTTAGASPAEPPPATTGKDAEKGDAEEGEFQLLFCGSNRWDLLGRKCVPKSVLLRGGSDAGVELLAPTRVRFEGLQNVGFTKVFSGPTAAHMVLVDKDGCAYGVGRNDCGQIGKLDLKSRAHVVNLAVPVEEGEKVVSASCGKGHTLVVTSSGRAFSCGWNAFGQLGNGARGDAKGKMGVWQTVCLYDKVVGVAAGADFSVFLCEDGGVFCCGNGQYGQLGNGRTGECIEGTGRVAFDVVHTPNKVRFPSEIVVTQVAAGSNHVLALDDKGKVWSWGWGGYGRLGHRTPKDEWRPRRIDVFDGPHYKLDFVACGSSASFAVQKSRKSCYFWGVTKKSGESNMYPKPLYDLQGWVVHAVGCGIISSVVAAERNLISWGSGVTYGELGYGKGEAKSSSKPKMMHGVEGLIAEGVAVGVAFTALLVRVDTAEEKAIAAKLEEYVVEDDTSGAEAEPQSDDIEDTETKSKAKPKVTVKRKSNDTSAPPKRNKKRNRA